ncbi:septal ring lytic transglycosylase RlpA family protein [Succinimonas amylolytica]|uniref:septal ring lytic transglycosylase RlpA family protein n=1 Tax=Succinimonas amylolytica TaxID=83769 RepID=UPI0023A8F3A9
MMNIIRCTGILFLTALTLFGCSSSHVPVTESGEKAASGCFYGTGAGNRCPQPQETPPDLAGVPGAKVTREPFSKRGNKDYTVFGQKFQVWRNLDSYTEEGMASWYGPGFHGQKTSNGEHYNMNGFTAAHKNLPLPCFLKVTNLANGKAVIVRVNDRGPFHGSRILDLSRGAAAKIGIIGPGTGKVRVEYINPGKIANQTSEAEMNGFKPYIQVFATGDPERAREISEKVTLATGKNSRVEKSGSTYRIKVGPLTEKEATDVLAKIRDLGYKNAYFTAG